MVIEGPHLLAAALDAGIQPIAVIGTQVALAKPEIRQLKVKTPPTVVTAPVFAAIADAETAPGIAAEIALPDLKREGPTVFLEGVQDPGNVGAIIRSAHALAGGTVVLGPDCADPFSPKAVRASMGSVFGVPLVRAGVEKTPAPRLALVAHGGGPLDGGGAATLCLGSEREGLPPEVLEQCERRMTIPLREDGAESLNVAAAAAIALQRISSPAPGQNLLDG